jgi:hypothetical protein
MIISIYPTQTTFSQFYLELLSLEILGCIILYKVCNAQYIISCMKKQQAKCIFWTEMAAHISAAPRGEGRY